MSELEDSILKGARIKKRIILAVAFLMFLVLLSFIFNTNSIKVNVYDKEETIRLLTKEALRNSVTADAYMDSNAIKDKIIIEVNSDNDSLTNLTGVMGKKIIKLTHENKRIFDSLFNRRVRVHDIRADE